MASADSGPFGTVNGEEADWVDEDYEYRFPEGSTTGPLLAAMVRRAANECEPEAVGGVLHGRMPWGKMRKDDSELVDSDALEALKAYSHYWDRTINGALRNGRIGPKVAQLVNTLVRAVRAAPAEENAALFRGVYAWKQFKVGEEFTEHGFFSATSCFRVAVDFTATDELLQDPAFDESRSTIFILRYPRAEKRIYLNDKLSLHQFEYESISFPGERWRVTEIGQFACTNLFHPQRKRNINLVTIVNLGNSSEAPTWVVDRTIDELAVKYLNRVCKDIGVLCTEDPHGGLQRAWKICPPPEDRPPLKKENVALSHVKQCLLYRGWGRVRPFDLKIMNSFCNVDGALRYGFSDAEGNQGVCREYRVTAHYLMMLFQDCIDWVFVDNVEKTKELADLFLRDYGSRSRHEEPYYLPEAVSPTLAGLLRPNKVGVSRNVKNAGLYIVVNGTELLVHRRARSLGHYICTPGGAIDDNENPMAAALRETVEECGAAPDGVVYPFCMTKYPKTFVAYVCHVLERPRVLGPDDRHIDEIDMEYDFANLPGASAIPGTGHAFVPIRGLRTWIEAHFVHRFTPNLTFLACLSLLEESLFPGPPQTNETSRRETHRVEYVDHTNSIF